MEQFCWQQIGSMIKGGGGAKADVLDTTTNESTADTRHTVRPLGFNFIEIEYKSIAWE